MSYQIESYDSSDRIPSEDLKASVIRLVGIQHIHERMGIESAKNEEGGSHELDPEELGIIERVKQEAAEEVERILENSDSRLLVLRDTTNRVVAALLSILSVCDDVIHHQIEKLVSTLEGDLAESLLVAFDEENRAIANKHRKLVQITVQLPFHNLELTKLYGRQGYEYRNTLSSQTDNFLRYFKMLGPEK